MDYTKITQKSMKLKAGFLSINNVDKIQYFDQEKRGDAYCKKSGIR